MILLKGFQTGDGIRFPPPIDLSPISEKSQLRHEEDVEIYFGFSKKLSGTPGLNLKRVKRFFSHGRRQKQDRAALGVEDPGHGNLHWFLRGNANRSRGRPTALSDREI
jgi:hypothetical protein